MGSKFKYSVAIIYLVLWIVYFLQGTFYEVGSIISQGTLAVILVLSFFYWGYAHIKYHLPKVLLFLDLFLLLNFIYGVYYIFDETAVSLGPKFNYLKDIGMSLLPIYVFYVFSREQTLTVRLIQIFSLLWIIVCVYSFYLNYQTQLLDSTSDRDEFTNNVGYSFLAMMPLWVYWYRNKILQFGLIFLTTYFIIIAMKRGAILIAVVVLLYYFYRIFKNSSLRQRGLILLLVIVMFVGIGFLINHLLATSDYFASRMEATKEGNSSGRDAIYSRLITAYFDESSPSQFYFGRGANRTIQLAGNYAHQDWLELAIDMGLVGVTSYFLFFIYLYLDIRIKINTPVVYTSLMIFFIILFISSLFSMGYMNLQIPMSLSLGYGLSQVKNI